ncbi:T9SS type A sorting domain-containing protein [Panacibacter ginsenosidivorans]|nr:T9SS type A sorting domain-containing protein [Panacibacter ginsenosidivorans]
MKKSLSTLSLILLISCAALCQCYGPTTTGTYLNGKKPSVSSNYFVNHIFSSFTDTTMAVLNGNSFTVSSQGGATSNTISSSIAPGESLVTGSGFPLSVPAMQSISTNSTNIRLTHTFSSDLQAGTHVYLQDIDMQEGWSIVFKDASGTVINPSDFTPFNVSTTNLPSTFTTGITSLSFKSTSGGNRSEPLVGIIITSSIVRTIVFSVTTVAGSASQTEIYYSVPVMPSFTATANSNSIVCSGSTLSLTAGTSALASTVPTPLTYMWSGPNSYSSSSTSNSSTISSITTAAAGTYTLQVKDAFGCFTTTAVTTSVAINTSPAITATGNGPVNYGNTINLSSSVLNGVAPYTFIWSGPNSFTATTQTASISTVSSANAGVYSVKVTGDNGCSATGNVYVAVKSAWIYIHDKNINEESSVNFTYKVKDSTGSVVNSFITNDSAGNTLNVYDLGAGHDDGAGTLWTIAGTAVGTSNTGTVYKRITGSSNWISTTVTTATAIDGAGLNQFVYVNNSGNAYFYNAGTSTLIFDHTISHNGQTANASDIAYGGGKIALRNANGRVYLYTGDFSNDSWTDISSNTNIADRIDISSDGSKIVYILSATVKTYTISTGSVTTFPVFTTTSGAGAASLIDVAIDDNGTIYGTGTTGNTSCCGNTSIVYSFAQGASAWIAEPEARGVQRLTGGPAGEAWGGVNIGTTFPQTIYTRVSDNNGVHIWLDDERVKNSATLYSNSIIMEYNAGTYKISAVMPDTTWDATRFNIYDPSGNTTGNSTTNTTTIKADYGEVVNVEFIVEKLNPKLIDNGNCNTSILQSFDAGNGTRQFGNGTFGTPLEGTAYHYFSQTSPQDGYYYLTKTTDGNWFTSPGVTDHTGNDGYFYLVNASYAKDEFYRQRITGLTENLTYRIQFYVSNVLPTNPIRPKIRFGMQTLGGVIFGDSTTAEITSSAWQLFSVSFTVPAGITTADLFLRNENIGGLGNDLAIDDISINPIPTPLTQNVISPSANLCVGSTYTISNSVTGGSWSTSDSSIVTVDSATSSITIHNMGTANVTYTYINNIYCVSKAVSTVAISTPPQVVVTTSSNDACKNGMVTLNSNTTSGTAPFTYVWSGNGGTLSSTTAANPVLTAPSTGGTYNYSVKVTDSFGCTSPVSTTSVTVHAPAAVIYPSCFENAAHPYTTLQEIGGTTGSSWLWSSSSDDALFYSGIDMTNGTATSTLQAPYVNYSSKYKVVLTDAFGCKDSTTMLFTNSMCSILSVSLLNFTAVKNNNDVQLNWSTATEANSKYFVIERSTDQQTWSQIGYVNAAGNSNTIKNYSFVDSLPFTGLNYYRLKQVDMDARYYLSSVRSVQISSKWKINIYPNPVTGNVLQLTSNAQLKTIIISDVYGRILLKRTASDITNADRVNIAGYAAGLYFIQVSSDENKVLRTSFIKY